MKPTVLLLALVASVLPTVPLAIAEEAAAGGTADKIESVDLEKKFGPVPAPSKPMRFAYVTKTLINEFWQDVAAGIKSEAGKYNIKFDAQAAKDESSLVEQLNLAQTILSQKPDALLLSPQSDSNLVPAIQKAKKGNRCGFRCEGWGGPRPDGRKWSWQVDVDEDPLRRPATRFGLDRARWPRRSHHRRPTARAGSWHWFGQPGAESYSSA
jgi:hypothetical protein